MGDFEDFDDEFEDPAWVVIYYNEMKDQEDHVFVLDAYDEDDAISIAQSDILWGSNFEIDKNIGDNGYVRDYVSYIRNNKESAEWQQVR